MKIELRNLALGYESGHWIIHPMNMTIQQGERIGVIGESGAGKSTWVKGIFHNMVEPLFAQGEILTQNSHAPDFCFLRMSKTRPCWNYAAIQNLWGKKISCISQEPILSLSPDYPIREQLEDVLKLHGYRPQQIQNLQQQLLDMAIFPKHRDQSVPQELSGGENQRAALALAMAATPEILIADEPTTGLDILVEKHIILTLQQILQQHCNMTLILVTHSLGVLNQLIAPPGKIVVFYQGHTLEQFCVMKTHGLDQYIYAHHPYTVQLWQDFYYNEDDSIWNKYLELPLRPQSNELSKDLQPENIGCPYVSHCHLYKKLCQTIHPTFNAIANLCITRFPDLTACQGLFQEQTIACHFLAQVTMAEMPSILENKPTEITQSPNQAAKPCANPQNSGDADIKSSCIAQIQHLSTGYADKVIIPDWSYELHQGDHLGILGQTGSGKSTLIKALSGLLSPNQWRTGQIRRWCQGTYQTMEELAAVEMPRYHNLNQMVWQHPSDVFIPDETVGMILVDAAKVWSKLWSPKESKIQIYERIQQVLQDLILPGQEKFLKQYPQHLSGGQRKRLLLASVLLACGYPHPTPPEYPRILYMDEPLRGIDVVNKKNVMNMLLKAAQILNATFVLITHDLGLAEYFCSKVMFLYQGEVVDQGLTHDILAHEGQWKALHPYTQELLNAMPHNRQLMQGN